MPHCDAAQDARSWFTWHLQQACYNTPLYNATQCADAFRVLPDCLERIELAYAQPTAARRHDALEFCNERLLAGDTHGRTLDNVNHKVRAPRPPPRAFS